MATIQTMHGGHEGQTEVVSPVLIKRLSIKHFVDAPASLHVCALENGPVKVLNEY